MKMGKSGKVFFAVLFMAAASCLFAAEHYRVLNGPKDFYFGHISYVDPAPGGADPVVLREGRSEPEPAVLNLPIGPGDTIRTSADRRCEIQFDTGTIVRLDAGTVLGVRTILARSLSSAQELSVLTLDKGRIYVMYKRYSGQEMFQVLTSNAAIKMGHNSVSILSAAPDGSTEAQVVSGRASVLFGPEAARLEDRKVKKGERLIVLPDHQSQLDAGIAGTAFELWNKEINARFEDLHEGLSPLPKPVQSLPKAVFYFAQAYGNRFGEWLWDDLYGYVWRPYIDNGRYPWGWSPYYYGNWSMAGGQMFWVPQEPWGWVPYHLGIWQWDKKLGWVWLPGSMFAPAWASWDFFFGYASWRPWSLFDWMYGFDSWSSGFSYFGDNLIYTPGWGGGGEPGKIVLVRNVIRKDSLKQPSAGSLPVPAELRSAVKKVTSAYEHGDPRVREGAAAVPNHLVIVAKSDLASRAIQEKALTLGDANKRGARPSPTGPAAARVADPRREASRIFRSVSGRSPLPTPLVAPAAGPWRRDIEPGAQGRPAVRPDALVRGPASAPPAPARFRDWNPDMRLARELGVRIEYSSVRNEVRCPELNLSSRDRERASGLAPRLTSRGVNYEPSPAAGGGTTAGSGSSGTSGTSTAAPSRTSGRSSSSSGAGKSESGGGGKIKN